MDIERLTFKHKSSLAISQTCILMPNTLSHYSVKLVVSNNNQGNDACSTAFYSSYYVTFGIVDFVLFHQFIFALIEMYIQFD